MATTKQPTGFSISRSGNAFTSDWKIGDKDYGDGQQAYYDVPTYGANIADIGKKATSRTIWLDFGRFFPYTGNYLSYVTMGARGNRDTYKKKGKNVNPGWSPWTIVTYWVGAPYAPILSKSYDEVLSNVCTFSWDIPEGINTASDSRIVSDALWQSILVKNSQETNGERLDWSNPTQSAAGLSGSYTFTEDTSILYKNGDSYTRWFRVQYRGPNGASGWVYSYRTYAIPRQANVLSVSANETEGRGFQCEVNWEVTSDMQYPIDQTSVQYTLAIPDEGLLCPSGASWSNADISKDTSNTDAAVFSIDDQLSKDQCLFVRVNTQFDSKTAYGKPTIAKIGYLKDPSDLSVETDPTTFRATISATNNSGIVDSVLVVRYVPSKGDPIIVGIIPHDESSVTAQCPDWSSQPTIAFDVYAMVGSYVKQERIDDVDSYSVVELAKSQNTLSKGGAVPVSPKNVSVQGTEVSGTIRVMWDWSWAAANSAEISWADHMDAWESTDEPDSYVISNLHASQWNISGLATGKTWYVRVRLLSTDSSGQNITYGPWSSIEQGTIDLSSVPNKPLLMLSNPVISAEGTVTASWVYTTNDRMPQAYAEVAVVSLQDIEVPISERQEGDIIVHDADTDTDICIRKVRAYEPIVGHTFTSQHLTIDAKTAGWETGQTYNLACRVRSASERTSEWSDVVAITIADPLECEISQISLVEDSIEGQAIDIETGEETTFVRNFLSLKEMPLSLTVTGAGLGGITSIVIERAESYLLNGPDENEFKGYEGEAIAFYTQVGETEIVLNTSDLIGRLDDGAKYRIIATVQDGLGQTASAFVEFEVHWEHQAVVPSVGIEVDEENLIVKITPIAPATAIESDTADIYRLSADKPELIVKGAQFGTTYVDPYPALGEMGGHRVVLVTHNGDFITEDNEIAMFDSEELETDTIVPNDEQLNIIDFDGRQIKFYYDTDYSNTWAKDFQETQYLGGSIQGDWNAAVSRSGTLSTQALTVLDQDMLQDVRRLAEHPGICHVRTADGSSYAADIQVSEDRTHDDQEMLANYSLSITRVDSQGFDGVSLEDWERAEEEEA